MVKQRTIEKMRYEEGTKTLRAVPENYCIATAYNDAAVNYPATMRRVALCVTACAGVPDDVLAALCDPKMQAKSGLDRMRQLGVMIASEMRRRKGG